jgi:hypothetical protein
MAARFPTPTLEERIRQAHAERSYLIGTTIGDGLGAMAKAVAAYVRRVTARKD